jgi:paraquat-inducible protein A
MDSQNSGRKSLSVILSGHGEIPIMIALAIVLLVFGLYLPTIKITQFIVNKSTFSILAGIQQLAVEGHVFLAIIVFMFSVIFPLIKLGSLLAVWFVPMTENVRAQCIEVLGHLGKWSMLDVYIVATTIVITKISALVHAEAKVGIYIFTLSIALSIIATERLSFLLRRIKHAT